jgi:hypothetical protein
VTMKNVVFWDVALCRYWVNRRFGGTYRLHLQGRKSSREEPASAGGSQLANFSTLKMEAIRSSETSVNAGCTQRHIAEDDILLNFKMFNTILQYLGQTNKFKNVPVLLFHTFPYWEPG